MKRFKRNSLSSQDSRDSVASGSHREEELFRLVGRVDDEQQCSKLNESEKLLISEAEFGLNVDSADEAHHTANKDAEAPSGEHSPNEYVQPKEGNSGTPMIINNGAKPEAGEGNVSPSGNQNKNKGDGVGFDSDESTGGQDKNKGDAADPVEDVESPGGQDKNEGNGKANDDDTKANLLINIIIRSVAFLITVTLVTFYLIEQIIPTKSSLSFRRCWEEVVSTLTSTPYAISTLFSDNYTKIIPPGPSNSSSKPKIVVTRH